MEVHRLINGQTINLFTSFIAFCRYNVMSSQECKHDWKVIRVLKNGNKIYQCKKCGATTTKP